MSEVKFCKDCKHFKDLSLKCGRREPYLDLVTGNEYKQILTCEEERYPVEFYENYCGINGKFWEAK